VPVNGTREALFAFAQAVVDRSKNAKVLMPTICLGKTFKERILTDFCSHFYLFFRVRNRKVVLRTFLNRAQFIFIYFSRINLKKINTDVI
jgi:hypothetical protein